MRDCSTTVTTIYLFFLIHTRFNTLTGLCEIYIFAWKPTFRKKSLVALYIHLFDLPCTKTSFERADVFIYESKSFLCLCIDRYRDEDRCNVQRICYFSSNESFRSSSSIGPKPCRRLEPPLLDRSHVEFAVSASCISIIFKRRSPL